MEETPWGDPDTTPVEPSEPSIPLRFYQLFAESRPVNDKVDRKAVELLLARAHLTPDNIAELLAENNAQGQVLDEPQFVRILFAAAKHLDQDPELLCIDPVEDLDTSERTAGRTGSLEDAPLLDISGPRTIKVEILGKEGRWGFKHTVYVVSGSLGGDAVLVHRRYSDFVWLLNHLVKVYPFRVLPLLPPKKIQLNGRFVSGDGSQFLYRRRLGLSRFLNLLVMHPVISRDKAVLAFLCNTSPVDVLRQQFSSEQDELENSHAQPSFMLDFDEKKYTKWLDSIQSATEKTLCITTNAAKALAIQSRRLYVQASEACNLTMDFESLVTQIKALYPDNQENLRDVARGVATFAKHNEQEHGAYLDSAAALQDGALDDIKYYRDILLATKELFRRHRVLGTNTIIQQKNRIERIRAKIDALRPSSGIGGPNADQIATLEAFIDELQLNIKKQVNRLWLMRQILSSELIMVQSSQYQLSRMMRNFASYRLAMSESFKTIAVSLYDEISDLPLK